MDKGCEEFGCQAEQEKEIPKTYEEYMAGGLFSKEWEAGFIAGKMHEIQREIERRVNEQV